MGGKGVWRWGKREIILIATHHNQNDSCIKMSSDERHFNVSLIVTRQCPQTTMFLEKGELKQYQTEVLLIISLITK